MSIGITIGSLVESEAEDVSWQTRRTRFGRFPRAEASFCKASFALSTTMEVDPRCRCACDVRTYLAADVDALAAERANKCARHAPQEPEPELEPEPEEEEEEADECPFCLYAPDASATLVCGHAFHRACIDDWATTEATCPFCRVAIEFPDDD